MAWNFPYLGETKELNEGTRAELLEKFVRLPDGYTHYQLGGPTSGQSVVLVHGFSVPYFIFDPTFESLTQAGFRVLRFDLFGRGFSDRPKTRYNIDLFTEQIRNLLDALGFATPVSLIGLSMGGPICAAFTEHYPEQVDKLVLIDPAGARSIRFSPQLKLLTLPAIGELTIGLFGNARMVKGIATDLYGPELITAFQKKFSTQMRYKGYKRAILSSIRNGMLGEFSPAYREVGRLGTPSLLIWGKQDKTIPFAHSIDIQSYIPQIEFHMIEDCGHIPHYEQPDKVNQILLEFLKK